MAEKEKLYNKPPTSDRNRVVNNTIFLAVRLLIVMGVAFYTSRVVLEALGIIDYGVYNVVAGVTSTFAFFSIAFASSTQRFLNYEMGKEDHQSLNRYFSMSLWLYCLLGAIVFVIGAALGPWLVFDVLVIPAESKIAALVVYYFALLNLALSLPLSVFEAAIIAHENMKVYAYLSVLEVMLKLGVAYGVMIMPHKLIFYGIAFVIFSFMIPKTILMIYCWKKYPESHPVRIWNKDIIKELMSFAGWDSYSSLVYVVNDQGMNVVLNMFFGPVVNAARGVSQQVYYAVLNFCSGFSTAVRPQIIKTYAAGDIPEVKSLFSFATRSSVFLVWIFSLPVMLRTDQILHIWLTEVPGYTVQFIIWSLVYGLVGTLLNPVIAIAQATGRMRGYTLWSANIFLLAFPLAIILLIEGAEPWIIFPCVAFTRAISIFAALAVLRKYIYIPMGWYVFKILGSIIIVIVLTLSIDIVFNHVFGFNFWGLVLFFTFSVITTSIVIYLVGLNSSEREGVRRKLIGIVSKFKHSN